MELSIKRVKPGVAIVFQALAATLLFLASCSSDQGNGGGGNEDLACSRSSQCPPGWVCDADIGYCVRGECAKDVPCAGGKVCREGKCVAACTSDADCPPAAKCYPPDGACYGGGYCETTSDCDAPTGSKGMVTCDTAQKICIASFTPCSKDDWWEKCGQDEYCHPSGWCAPRPDQCTPDMCPPGTFCNQDTGKCEELPDCDEGYEHDPVDGTCRLGLCTSDGDCNAGEWCDLLGTGMCRGKCENDSGCLQSEKCETSTGRCRKDQGCDEGQECGSCDCREGLICWDDPAKPGDDEYCLKSCDPVSGVSTCPSGTKCAPLAEKNGDFSLHRGACITENGGGQATQECSDQAPCERDLLCVEGICRTLCDPGAPSCGHGEKCNDHRGMGVCQPEPTCDSDLDCDPPSTICDLSARPGSCVDGCSASGCGAGQRCNTETGRCDPDQSCVRDDDCGVPNYVCIEDRCSASCVFRGCRLPLLCNHTTGRCSHGCSVDLDCGPPDRICEQGECVDGCASTGCPSLETCDPSTGRCTKSSCDDDQDCDPPNTICDYAVTKLCVPGCLGVGCENQDEVCDAQTGRCIKSCTTDYDCKPPKEICISGRCSPGCTVEDGLECKTGTECDPVTGRCKPTFCSRDSDCDPPYFICDFGTSLCVHGCVTNGCGPGQTCNQTTGRCQ